MNIHQWGKETALLLQPVTIIRKKPVQTCLRSTEGKHGKSWLEKGKSGSASDLGTYKKYYSLHVKSNGFQRKTASVHIEQLYNVFLLPLLSFLFLHRILHHLHPGILVSPSRIPFQIGEKKRTTTRKDKQFSLYKSNLNIKFKYQPVICLQLSDFLQRAGEVIQPHTDN